jgi:hypothetical protein
MTCCAAPGLKPPATPNQALWVAMTISINAPAAKRAAIMACTIENSLNKDFTLV